MPLAAPPADPLADASDLARLGADALRTGYADGTISPVEVAKAVLDRAEAISPAFNTFTWIDRAGALEAAVASESRWRGGTPLSSVDGIPTTLKDIVWAKSWSVRYGSTTTDPEPCETDAPAVRLLREAGCVFIGQTTTPEFGWKAVTDSALCGITRNPHDPSKTPGGSSGGAAVAAATGAGARRCAARDRSGLSRHRTPGRRLRSGRPRGGAGQARRVRRGDGPASGAA
ncbi:amidase family protein [Aureimonas sp. AU12]|uniref:amidase family protein n=1 Tax=Aureimonas sp. AU12 TaxID=1638161 RepID=UPI0007803AEF|nr:amidase family protein [Aureimonas sp. AU12]